MRKIKGVNIDVLGYLYDIPYTISFDNGRKVAVIDLIYTDKLVNKSFWVQALNTHFKVLSTVLLMMGKHDDGRVLQSIVEYYFSNHILRQLSYVPEYLNYPKLVDAPPHSDLITEEVWQPHISYLNDLREKSRIVLNNNKIPTTYLTNLIRKSNPKDISSKVFTKRMAKLIVNHPEVLLSLLLFTPQESLVKALGKEELTKLIENTRNRLVSIMQSLRKITTPNTGMREAVYYAHSQFGDEIKEFKQIRHVVDTVIVHSLAGSEVYRALFKIVTEHLTSLKEFKTHVKFYM